MDKQNANFTAWCAREHNLQDAQIVKELSGGNSNLTQLINTEQGPLVLRTPPANTISPKAHKGVERESIVMKALHGHAPVPGVVAWCEDPGVIGRPFVLVEHIDGVSITDELPAAYESASAINTLGEQLTDALADIATAPWQDLGLENLGNPQNFLARQINRWLEVRQSATARPLPQLDSLGEWLLANIPANGPVGVVHGDYHLDNALCSRERPELLAVIDWEMATIGDPLTDLGLFLMFWGPRKVDPPGFKHVQAVSRVDSVISRQELAHRWSQKTGIDIGALNFYLCFSFWRLAAIVEGAYKLYLDGKVDTPYARGLEYDVPALLEEAQLAAEGNW